MWITIATSCETCNARMVFLTENEPTKQEIDHLISETGNMFCIRTVSKEIKLNTAVDIRNDYEDY